MLTMMTVRFGLNSFLMMSYQAKNRSRLIVTANYQSQFVR
jgi:hypothetical protein